MHEARQKAENKEFLAGRGGDMPPHDLVWCWCCCWSCEFDQDEKGNVTSERAT
jgi:hypothetical protein